MKLKKKRVPNTTDPAQVGKSNGSVAVAETKQYESRINHIIPGIPEVKPPPVAPYTGKDVLNDTSELITLTLDKGCFMYLWAKLEVHAREDHMRFGVVGTGAERVSRETLGAVINAAIHHGIVTLPTATTKKRLKKKAAA